MPGVAVSAPAVTEKDRADLAFGLQELGVEHGFLVPMNLCFPHSAAGWPVKSIPLQVNVVQHPLPTSRRCYKLGQAIRNAISSYKEDLKVVILGTGGSTRKMIEIHTAGGEWRLLALSAIGWIEHSTALLSVPSFVE